MVRIPRRAAAGGIVEQVEVRIDGVVAKLGQAFSVPFDNAVDRTRVVSVVFLGEHADPKPIEVTVTANAPTEVPCVLR